MAHLGAYGGEFRPNALPHDVLRVLREFSTAIGNHTMYSEGHPMLALVAQRLWRLLGIHLSESSSLAITVRRDCLAVGAGATDPLDLRLSGLANRLHLHQLHSLTFRRGVQPDEVTALLKALSQKVGVGGAPLGLAPDEDLSRWSHIGVLRADVLSGASDPQAQGIRTGLDSASFFTELAGVDLLETESESVARSIEAQLQDEQTDQSIAAQIFKLAENLRDASGERAEILFRRMSELVFLLEADTLTHLLKLGDEGKRTNRFLRDSSEWMESDAIIELMRTAAENRHDGIAPRVLRLTSKLTAQADSGDRPHGAEADSAIRTTVRRLIEEWELEDGRPEDDADELPPPLMSRPTSRYAGEAGVSAVQPARTVKMCIELDVANEGARRASESLVSAGEAATLLDLLEQAPTASNVASQLWRAISTPQALRQLLETERPDFDVLDRITEHVGLAGVESMLDVLARSTHRFARLYLLEQISGMGPKVGPQVASLLHDRRWYVVRNMLRLLRSLNFRPEGLDIALYLDHQNPRVRIEALRLAAGWQDQREQALSLALQDADDRVVAAGLAEASLSCPAAVEQILARHLQSRTLPEELRAQAIQALGTLGSRGALKAIAGACVRRRGIFGRKLSSEAAIVQAGIHQLASRWPEARVTQRILRLAARSGKPGDMA